MDYFVIFCSLALGFLIPTFRILFWKPYVLTKFFRKQGIVGPPYQLFLGSLIEMFELSKIAKDEVLDTNSNDIVQKVTPYSHTWLEQYGKTFIYWYGMQPRVCIGDAELAKQTLSADKSTLFVKPYKERPLIEVMIGKFGLFLNSGSDWFEHRKVLNPAFSSEKIKGTVKSMAECTISMVEEWKEHEKIDVNEEFMRLTSDIIAHIAFGMSYVRGKEILDAQKELQRLVSASAFLVFIPGSQYLPTRANFKIWKLHRNMTRSIKSIIETRLSRPKKELSENPYGDDLLGMMLGASESNRKGKKKLRMDEILDECKAFFFGGQETTSNLLTWTAFLLSIHQDWQQKLRDEVLKQCGRAIPDADMVANLKLVNMVVLETLRLYGPSIELKREALQDTKLGNMMIPKGTHIMIRVMHIHREKEYWGEDADKFNPLRFANGVSKAAKHPDAFLPFGSGPRTCIAQKLALLEAKTVMAMLLQRFSWSLSSEYKHTPFDNITMQPQLGLPLIIKPLNP